VGRVNNHEGVPLAKNRTNCCPFSRLKMKIVGDEGTDHLSIAHLLD